MKASAVNKKFALVGLLFASAAFAGCTIFPPTSESAGSVLRSWGHDVSGMQILADKYFMNYDYYNWFND